MVALDLQVKIHAFVNKGVGEQGELFDGVFSLQAVLVGNESLEPIAKIGFQELDMAGDMLIEFIQVFCRDPELLKLGFTHGMLFEPADVIILHLELGHIAGKLSVFDIPVQGDLTGIFQLKNRVKNRLLRQARRKGFHAAVVDQRQLLQTNRTIKDHVASELSFIRIWRIRLRICIPRGSSSVHYKSLFGAIPSINDSHLTHPYGND